MVKTATQAHVYTFAWPGLGGPACKRFTCPHLFDQYVMDWRDNFGPVDWPTPFVARGAL